MTETQIRSIIAQYLQNQSWDHLVEMYKDNWR